MKIHFCGGAQTVTGSNYLLETEKTKVLVDCGLFQGGANTNKLNNEDFPYKPNEIDVVFITHAHIDHIGRLLKLVSEGFNGKIFSTLPTVDFIKIMLSDSENIARKRGERQFYGLNDIEKTVGLFQGIDYGKKIELDNGISFCFRDAGHILGSAIVEIWAEDNKIVFSGDMGNSPVPLLRETEVIGDADYVVIESTYGDRIHETVSQRKDLLENAIEDIVSQGGTMLIPSFALERTQEILYELNELVENHRIPRIPIFLDSPLAIKLTEVYKRHSNYFNKEAKYLIESGDELFNFPGLKLTQTSQESKSINNIAPPKIIIAGSGMSTGGRILHHEIRYLSDPNNIFLIVCYQANGTLGRKIFDGAEKVRIFNQIIPVKSRVRAIGGYSAHADQETLYSWISKIARHENKSGDKELKKVFVTHGEKDPADALAQIIKDRLGVQAVVPKMGQSFVL
ncbi:MBL fold metallo-hydrolase [Patescibacteria group bacterium]